MTGAEKGDRQGCERMICPSCNGAKGSEGFVICDTRKGPSGWSSGPRWFPCTLCRGVGTIDDVQNQWRIRGLEIRAARLASDRSISEEAKRLGIKVSVLSDMEHGRIKPLRGSDEPR